MATPIQTVRPSLPPCRAERTACTRFPKPLLPCSAVRLRSNGRQRSGETDGAGRLSACSLPARGTDVDEQALEIFLVGRDLVHFAVPSNAFLRLGFGACGVALLGVNTPKQVMSFGKVGLDFDGRFKVLAGLGVPAECPVKFSQQKTPLRERRIASDGELRPAYRLASFGLSRLGVEEGEIVERQGVGRVKCRGRPAT